MTKTNDETETGRQVDAAVTVDAPVEAVWKALTDAAELRRWFPMDARVTPGEGGRIWLSWGSDWEFTNGIEIWEPNRHLRTVTKQPAPEPGKGSEETLKWASADASGEARVKAVRVAVDYHLEGKGGKTVLRLVHSGFGAGAEWDDEYNEVRRGWAMELQGLRLYLERHRGEDREIAWVRRAFAGPAEEGWSKLTSPDGFVAKGSLDGLKGGDRYRIETTPGDTLEGTVLRAHPPHGFAGSVESLGGGLFRIMIMDYYGRREASLMLSAWGKNAAAVPALKERWGAWLHDLEL